MAIIALNTGDTAGESYEAYPADTYYCEIEKADLELSKFKDDKTGEDKYQLAVVWSVYQLTEDQAEAGLTTGKWFRQWFTPWYGDTKNGPSKFKQFIDSLRAQGHLGGFDEAERVIDTDWLLGIKQKVTVTEAPRADGTMANKVAGVSPLKPQRRQPAAQPAPAAKPAAPARPATRNAPVAVAEEGEGDGDLF